MRGLDVVKLHLAIAASLHINVQLLDIWSGKASEKLNCLLCLCIVGAGGGTKGYLDH